MDQIGGMNIVYYSLDYVKTLFQNNPQYLNNTKGREIYIGWLVANIIKNNGGPFLVIGIPLREVEKHENPRPGPLFEQILENIEMIDDTDVDLYLSGDKDFKTPFLPIQVTRLVPKFNNMVINNDIYSLLKKKFRVQTDKSMILVISIEDDYKIEIDEISNFLDDRPIPYGKILVVGNVEKDKNLFNIVELYPEMAEYEPVILH